MGKKIIIKGADFSENGLLGEVDLTNLFTFTSGSYASNGATITTNVFEKSNIINIGDYAGRKMKISFCNYLTSSGGRPSYCGILFMDADEEVIRYQQVLKGDKENGKGESVEVSVLIPETATSFKTTYLKDTTFYGEPVPFYCYILGE